MKKKLLQNIGKPKLIYFLLFSFFIFGFSVKSDAQTYPKDYGFWMEAGENQSKGIDISCKSSKCSSSSSDSLFVRIFNEKAIGDTTSFDVIMYNNNQSDSTVTSIVNFVLESGEMADHDCGSGSNSSLAIPIPTGYDPEKITIHIKFN